MRRDPALDVGALGFGLLVLAYMLWGAHWFGAVWVLGVMAIHCATIYDRYLR